MIRLGKGSTSAAAYVAHTTEATATGTCRGAYHCHGIKVVVSGAYVKGWENTRRQAELCGLKEETHAARWGLLRGYSGKATKWVDFVVTDSTRRESCHFHRVVRNKGRVKGKSRPGDPTSGSAPRFLSMRCAHPPLATESRLRPSGAPPPSPVPVTKGAPRVQWARPAGPIPVVATGGKSAARAHRSSRPGGGRAGR